MALFLISSLSIPAGAANMFPLGVRLNNPGNLERTDDIWNGQARLQTDKRFVRFLTPYAGLRALMKVLITYDDIYGLSTVSRIVSRWAPDGENNTYAYISDVSSRTGFSPNTIIDLKNPQTLMHIAQAIVIHEQGHSPAYMPEYWYEEAAYHEAAMGALYDDV